MSGGLRIWKLFHFAPICFNSLTHKNGFNCIRSNFSSGIDVPMPSSSKQCAKDIVSLLSGELDFEKLPLHRSFQLLDCLKHLSNPYLAESEDACFPRLEFCQEIRGCPCLSRKKATKHAIPHNVTSNPYMHRSNRRRLAPLSTRRNIENMIRFPPLSVLEFSRAAVQSGGNASFIKNHLSAEIHDIPDVEGSRASKCQLGRNLNAKRFKDDVLNHYFAFLFLAIEMLAPAVNFQVALTRFDLFHAHLFITYESGRLGALFHAREYPSFCLQKFPINLGFCQRNSNIEYDDSMNFRNILWMAPLYKSPKNKEIEFISPGVLCVLDANPQGIIFKEMISEDVDIVRTIYEDDFGHVIRDINYFSLENDPIQKRIFVCI